MADCSELYGISYELAMDTAKQSNVNNLSELTTELRKMAPELTREQVVDLVARSGIRKANTMSAEKKKLAAIKNQARSDKRLLDSIGRVEAALEEGELLASEKKPKKDVDKYTQRLRDELKDLQQQLNQSTPALKARLQKSIDESIKKLSQDVVIAPVKKRELSSDPEVRRLENRATELKAQVRNRVNLERARQQKLSAGTREVFNFTKAITSSVDAGFVGRQGLFVSLANPDIFTRSFGRAYMASKSDEGQRQVLEQIENDEQAVDLIRFGGALSSDKSFREEEAFFGNIEGLIESGMRQRGLGFAFDNPASRGVGAVMRASERAHVTFLNVMRLELYKSLASKLPVAGKPTEKEGRLLAEYVNVATGHGDPEILKKMMPALQNVFWSPRYQISRVQFILSGLRNTLPGRLVGKAVGADQELEAARKVIGAEYNRLVMGGTALYSSAVVAGLGYKMTVGGDDDEVYIGRNPTKSDFGSLRLGDASVDLTGGTRTWLVMASRLASKKLTTRKDKDLPIITDDEQQAGMIDATGLTTSFFRGKSAPLVGAAADQIVGDPFDNDRRPSAADTTTRLLVPLSILSGLEQMREQGMTAGAALTMSDFFGFPVGNMGSTDR